MSDSSTIPGLRWHGQQHRHAAVIMGNAARAAVEAESLASQYLSAELETRDLNYIYRLQRLSREAIPHPTFDIFKRVHTGYTSLQASEGAIAALAAELVRDGMSPDKVERFAKRLHGIAEEENNRILAEIKRTRDAANAISANGQGQTR